jgi:DDE superfamily endonuclease/Tc5 transposase DNA-binding domain
MEQQLQRAIDAFQRGGFDTKAAAARYFDIPYKRFIARLQGRLPRTARPATYSRLADHEEKAIIQFMDAIDSMGMPGNKYTIQTTANYLLRMRGDLNPVSRNWTTRFLARHSTTLRVKKDSPKDVERAAAEDPVAINSWLQDFNSKCERLGIQPEDLWNMDETGFRIGIGKRQTVIVSAFRPRSRISTAKNSTRESVTVVEAVNAAGSVIPPMIIMKSPAGYIMEDWVKETKLPDSTLLATSEKAYIDDELALVYIRHFDRATSGNRQKGEYRMLVIDGHECHQTYEFMEFCREKKIILYFLEPHTTHICQPLDVNVFQAYKHYHARAVGDFHSLGITGITKTDFLDIVESIRRQTFKEQTIKSAFAKTGLFPFNPSVVLDQIRTEPEARPETPETSSDPSEADITPTDQKSLDRLLQAARTGLVQQSEIIEKLARATATSFSRNLLSERHMFRMTAANIERDRRNNSKRRVNGLVGEPGTAYVGLARRAVKRREIQEAEKIERKRVRQAQKQAAVARGREQHNQESQNTETLQE